MSELARLPMADLMLLRGIAAAQAQILAELRELRALVERKPLPDPATAAFLRAVDSQWGNAAFRGGELLKWASDPAFASRRAVLAAAERVCCGATPTAHALGLRLSTIAGAEADGLRLERVAAREKGSRLWAVIRGGGVNPI